ncbi:MAG TPA: hypothetical protein VMA09_20800 [Candidatus Binataceae bacterium]|nr:hypothetical protein [Candidatus Binataceae bacterium]
MQLTNIEEALPPTAVVPDTGPSAGKGAERLGRLPLGRKTGYAAGQLVELIVGSMLNVFVLFYVTAVCGLPGGLAGLALGAGIDDGLVDYRLRIDHPRRGGRTRASVRRPA